jgi:hypothetical protein
MVTQLEKLDIYVEKRKRMLEIDTNSGILGSEIKKAFGTKVQIDLIEQSELARKESKKITAQIDQTYSRNDNTNSVIIYDEILNSLNVSNNKYDIVWTIDGLCNKKTCDREIKQISNIIVNDGYFVAAFKASNKSYFDYNNVEFVFSTKYLLKILALNNFEVEKKLKIPMVYEQSYFIFLCRKRQT